MKLYATLEIPDNLLDDKKKFREVLEVKLKSVCAYFLSEEIIDTIINEHLFSLDMIF